MAREYTQTVNAAQMFKIVPSVNMDTGMMTLAAGYVVGKLSEDGQFGSVTGAAVSDTAAVVVPLSMTLGDANRQLMLAIAQQEGLDLDAGDHVLPPI